MTICILIAARYLHFKPCNKMYNLMNKKSVQIVTSSRLQAVCMYVYIRQMKVALKKLQLATKVEQSKNINLFLLNHSRDYNFTIIINSMQSN